MYLVIVLVWPWSPIRFIIPILPFTLAYFLKWTKQVLQKVPFLPPQWLTSICFLTILAVNLSIMIHTTQSRQSGHYPLIGPSKELVTWQSYEDVFRWIKDHTKPTDVIASSFDTMIFLYTGRQAFRFFLMKPMSILYGEKDPALKF
jgi:hypothetical protein